jgi:hypothetical protein
MNVFFVPLLVDETGAPPSEDAHEIECEAGETMPRWVDAL